MAVARDTELAWPDSKSAPTNITVITDSQLYEDSALALGILHVAISQLMQCDAQSDSLRERNLKLVLGVSLDYRI